MLNIYVRDRMEDVPKSIEYIHDVELGFNKIRLQDTDLNRKLLKNIEQAEYCDIQSFIDRFGYKLYTKYMSTGCKAALCVANMPDKLINVAECGLNAISSIIHNCTEGNILVSDDMVMFKGRNIPIQACLDGKIFTNIDDLAYYAEKIR